MPRALQGMPASGAGHFRFFTNSRGVGGRGSGASSGSRCSSKRLLSKGWPGAGASRPAEERVRRLERGAPLHRAIRFNPQDVAARHAAPPVVSGVRAGRAQEALLGPEVPQVVAGHEGDAVLEGARLQGRDAREQLQQIPRLEEHGGAVRRAPERGGELELPGADALRLQVLMERLQVGLVEPVGPHADGLLRHAPLRRAPAGGQHRSVPLLRPGASLRRAPAGWGRGFVPVRG
jgi:hypothetical protein